MWVHFRRWRIPSLESYCPNCTFIGETCSNNADILKTWQITEQDVSLFDSSKNLSARVVGALSNVLRHTPSVPSIIVTDLQEIAVFIPSQAGDSGCGTYERVKTTQFPLALRVITAAYLDDELPARVFLNCPDVDNGVDTDLVLPEGPQQDPSPQALPTDQTVFATCHRHSDFDIPTLVRDPERVSQFFRWKEHVRSHYSKSVAHFNDVLTGVTNEIGLRLVPFPRPLFPLELSDIPKETMSHLKEIQREPLFVAAGVADELEKSEKFPLKIQDIIAKGTQHGFCTVYRCEITSIDDQPIMWCPPLCLKLFDDRFQSLFLHEEDDEKYSAGNLHRLFYRMSIAEVCALKESLAYKKLQQVQGSIVPWFYSTHQVSYFLQQCISCIYQWPLVHIAWWDGIIWSPDGVHPRTSLGLRDVSRAESLTANQIGE